MNSERVLHEVWMSSEYQLIEFWMNPDLSSDWFLNEFGTSSAWVLNELWIGSERIELRFANWLFMNSYWLWISCEWLLNVLWMSSGWILNEFSMNPECVLNMNSNQSPKLAVRVLCWDNFMFWGSRVMNLGSHVSLDENCRTNPSRYLPGPKTPIKN